MFRITKALAGATILLITTVACVNRPLRPSH